MTDMLTATTATLASLDVADIILDDLRGFAEAVLAELPHPSRIVDYDRHLGVDVDIALDGIKDGIQIVIRRAQERGRVRVKADVPQAIHACAAYVPVPAITLSAMRPTRHLAAAIARDLIPDAVAYTIRCRNLYDAAACNADATAAVLAAITRESLGAVKGLGLNHTPRHPGDLRNIRFSGGFAQAYASGEVRDGLTRLELDHLSQTQVEAIMRVLAATDGTITVAEEGPDDTTQ